MNQVIAYAKATENGSSQTIQPIRLAGSVLDKQRHVCAFFRNPEEEYRVMLPFIKDGLNRGEKAFQIVNPRLRDEHKQRLVAAGINVAAAEKSGQFELIDWDESYLQDGHFVADRLLALVQQVLERSKQEGFPRTRLIGHMEWAMEARPGVEDLLEYEIGLNSLLPKYKNDFLICTYDLSKFGGEIVVDVMRTHPMTIVGGMLQENPFYVKPDQFLSEIRAGRSKGPQAASLRREQY